MATASKTECTEVERNHVLSLAANHYMRDKITLSEYWEVVHAYGYSGHAIAARELCYRKEMMRGAENNH